MVAQQSVRPCVGGGEGAQSLLLSVPLNTHLGQHMSAPAAIEGFECSRIDGLARPLLIARGSKGYAARRRVRSTRVRAPVVGDVARAGGRRRERAAVAIDAGSPGRPARTHRGL